MYVYMGRAITFISALASCGYCDKVSQTWWLQTVEMYSPIGLYDQSLK